MNKTITSDGIESVILKLLKSKIPGPDGLTIEIYQTFKEQLISILLKPFFPCQLVRDILEQGASFADPLHPLPIKHLYRTEQR